MRAYIIRRLLLMVPTLFGVTLVCFFIMKLAPGDPLKEQLSQAGSQGESNTTREAYLHQRRQWKLDKPTFLNTRWFRGHSFPARLCSHFQAMGLEELGAALERLAGPDPGSGPSGIPREDELRFLRDLQIEAFEARLPDASRRGDFAKIIRTAVQLKTEELSDYGVTALADLLRTSKDVRLKIGAIRSLSIALLGDPFIYTYSTEPEPAETERVISTWRIWWNREQEKYPALAEDRRRIVEQVFRSLVAEPSRGKILEGVKQFARGDMPFFAAALLGPTTLKEKYVASIALRAWVGKPLRVDVKVNEAAPQVEAVAANWLAFIEASPGRFSPSFAVRAWRFLVDTQYANSLVRLATFDFGKSMVKPYDAVGPKIWEAVKVSAPIMLLVEVIVYLFAIPVGVYCAVRRGRWQDRAISLNLFLLHSMPSVVAGMLFLTVFCYGQVFRIFPVDGLHSEGADQLSSWAYFLDYLWHIAGPVAIYVIHQLAYLAVYMRSSMLDTVHQDYVRTARAKGLGETSVIGRHALRNALIPVITLFSSFIPALLGGSVIVEYLFGIHGMGRLSWQSIDSKDYNTVMAIIYIDAIIVMVSILLTDLLYVFIDPRISFSKLEGAA